jgi:hypothetical protein
MDEEGLVNSTNTQIARRTFRYLSVKKSMPLVQESVERLYAEGYLHELGPSQWAATLPGEVIDGEFVPYFPPSTIPDEVQA